MEFRPILLLLVLLGSAAAAQEAYRWVDEDGIVHYSDRPREGAEQILLPTPNVATTRRIEPRQQPGSPADDAAQEPSPGYETISIVSPESEQTLWNIEGVLNVSVSLTPPLKPRRFGRRRRPRRAHGTEHPRQPEFGRGAARP